MAGSTLTKREIAERISQELGFSVRMSLRLVDEFFHHIKASLQEKEKVKIVRFGTLCPIEKAARRGTSPANGEPIIIPARQTVVFRPSRILKGLVNAERGEEILSNR